MNKKVIAIQGSPRSSGVTAKMLDCAVKSAEAVGCKVTRINLNEANLAYCMGCRACLDSHKCVQKDDIHKIAELIKESDLVVLAAPVYWANVPAVVKNLFDRMLVYSMQETKTFPKPLLSGRKYMLLTACSTPAPFSWIFGQSRGALRCMDEYFKTAGMKPIGRFVCSNTAKSSELPDRMKRKIEKRLEHYALR